MRAHPTARILALHAAGVGPEMWADVQALTPELDWIAPDLVSVLRDSGGTLEGMVRGLVAATGDAPVVVTGCAFGALLALEVAEPLGDRIRGVSLLAPPPPGPGEEFLSRVRALARLAADGWTDEMSRSLVPLVLYRYGPNWLRASRRLERMLLEHVGRSADLLAISDSFGWGPDLVERIRAPVRALIGANNGSPLIGPTLVDAWRGLLGAENTTRVEGAAEYIPLDRPELVADELRRLATRGG